jgi:hypothetical protein
VTESEPLSFADLKPRKTPISAQPPMPESGPGQGTLPGEQNRIVPSIPRPALRGLDAPPDSIPRIPVVHQQPQPTTSAQTGQSIDPLAVKSGLSNISPIYPQTGYSSTMAPGFGQVRTLGRRVERVWSNNAPASNTSPAPSQSQPGRRHKSRTDRKAS